MIAPTYQVCLLKIPVSDIRSSSKFYQEALEFTEEFAAEEYGWAQLKAGDLPFALYQPGLGGGDGVVGSSAGFHLSVDAKRFDALAKRLIPQGFVLDNQVHQGDDGTTFFDLRDPDGNTLKIMRASNENAA